MPLDQTPLHDPTPEGGPRDPGTEARDDDAGGGGLEPGADALLAFAILLEGFVSSAG